MKTIDGATQICSGFHKYQIDKVILEQIHSKIGQQVNGQQSISFHLAAIQVSYSKFK